MPVINIIDTRTNENNPTCDAVLEIWKHGIGPKVFDGGHIKTEWIEKTTIKTILEVAMHYQDNVTVYLYDPGKVQAEINSMPVIHSRIKDTPMELERSKVYEVVT